VDWRHPDSGFVIAPVKEMEAGHEVLVCADHVSADMIHGSRQRCREPQIRQDSIRETQRQGVAVLAEP